jgi:hypothetical protein
MKIMKNGNENVGGSMWRNENQWRISMAKNNGDNVAKAKIIMAKMAKEK